MLRAFCSNILHSQLVSILILGSDIDIPAIVKCFLSKCNFNSCQCLLKPCSKVKHGKKYASCNSNVTLQHSMQKVWCKGSIKSILTHRRAPVKTCQSFNPLDVSFCGCLTCSITLVACAELITVMSSSKHLTLANEKSKRSRHKAILNHPKSNYYSFFQTIQQHFAFILLSWSEPG